MTLHNLNHGTEAMQYVTAHAFPPTPSTLGYELAIQDTSDSDYHELPTYRSFGRHYTIDVAAGNHGKLPVNFPLVSPT